MAEQSRKTGKDAGDKGTRKVVIVAMIVNALIAVAKFGAGIIGGSSSMLAEGAHSIADTANEGFLLLSLNLADNAPDEEHPFGHGKDRFFWSFFAAVFIFVSGAVFSFYEGLSKIFSSGSGHESFLVDYIVLVVAFICEAVSWTVTIREIRGSASEHGRSFFTEVKLTRNTTIKLPAFEDTAALIGLVFAAAGLVLTELTGNHLFDGLGSIAIGLLLSVLAWLIGTDSRDLLLGTALVPEDRERVRAIILRFPEVEYIVRLFSMYIGPETALVTAKISVRDGLLAGEVEQLMVRVDEAIVAAVPEVKQTFLELHPGNPPR